MAVPVASAAVVKMLDQYKCNVVFDGNADLILAERQQCNQEGSRGISCTAARKTPRKTQRVLGMFCYCLLFVCCAFDKTTMRLRSSTVSPPLYTRVFRLGICFFSNKGYALQSLGVAVGRSAAVLRTFCSSQPNKKATST